MAPVRYSNRKIKELGFIYIDISIKNRNKGKREPFEITFRYLLI